MIGILVWLAGCVFAAWEFWKHAWLHEAGIVCATLVALAWFALGLANLHRLSSPQKFGPSSIPKHSEGVSVK